MSDISTSQTERNNTLLAWLRKIGAFRDSFLVAASLIYILGYVVRASHAAANNLGSLPAIESQYFTAGIVPLAILISVWFIIQLVTRFRQRLYSWMRLSSDSMSRKIVRGILGIYLIGMIIIFMIEPLRNWALLGLPAFLFVDFIFFRDDNMRMISSVYTYAIPLFFAFVALVLYIFVIFPIVPQELGGVRPRCAFLDVVAEQLSQETRSALLPPGMQNQASRVIHSVQTDVLFSGDNFLLVRPVPSQGASEIVIYEIRRDALQAITWCGQGTPWLKLSNP